MFKATVDGKEIHLTEEGIRTLCGKTGVQYVLNGKVTCPVCLAEKNRIEKHEK